MLAQVDAAMALEASESADLSESELVEVRERTKMLIGKTGSVERNTEKLQAAPDALEAARPALNKARQRVDAEKQMESKERE